MQKRKRRTFSDMELIRAVRADQERRAKELREQKQDAKPRRRPIFIPTAGPSLRDLLRRRTREHGPRGRTVAGFSRSPWIPGKPKQEIGGR